MFHVTLIKTNKDIFSIHILPQPGSESGGGEVGVRGQGRGSVRRPPVVEVVVRRVHHEGEHLHPPGQLLLGAQDVGGGVEALVGRGAVAGGQQPRDHGVLVRVLVREEAAQLGVVDVLILHVDHGHDVANVPVLALVVHALTGRRGRSRWQTFDWFLLENCPPPLALVGPGVNSFAFTTGFRIRFLTFAFFVVS